MTGLLACPPQNGPVLRMGARFEPVLRVCLSGRRFQGLLARFRLSAEKGGCPHMPKQHTHAETSALRSSRNAACLQFLRSPVKIVPLPSHLCYVAGSPVYSFQWGHQRSPENHDHSALRCIVLRSSCVGDMGRLEAQDLMSWPISASTRHGDRFESVCITESSTGCD